MVKFCIEDENTGKLHGFTVNCTIDKLNELIDDDKYLDWMSDNGVETIYGVHDGTGGEDWSGFTSYEIKDKKFPELIEIHRKEISKTYQCGKYQVFKNAS